ncbi:JID1 [Candida margitis]|uniref:JID1 n=1 Tax=Candida margitis TaxID=1775924 RepID=UPI002226336E|nr:JID1 [Candida margitis]KAI5969954.1 JID1 [Candida margitis]
MLSAHRLKLVCIPCTYCRMYATSSNDFIDHHKRLDLHGWPTSKTPTPYEVFGLSSKDIGMSRIELNKVLKLRYVKLVKIYHPDTSLDLTDNYGKALSDEQKRKRFDLIQESYDILRNARRRVAYNRFKTTSWEQQGPYNPSSEPFSKEGFEAYRRANAHRARYDFSRDEAFWSAGTWNDYYQMKYQRPPPTKEDLEKNKYKILFGVLAIGALAFGLQIMSAIDRTNQYLVETHKMNLKSMRDLNQSYEGDGSYSEADNVRKFLIGRRTTMRSKKDEFREEEPSDDELLHKYAKGRVDKWDRQEQEWNQRRQSSSDLGLN